MEPTRFTPLNFAINEFYIGRMVSKIGLVRIGIMSDLSTARARIEELTESWPGDYIVFQRSTGRVVAKVSSTLQHRRHDSPSVRRARTRSNSRRNPLTPVSGFYLIQSLGKSM
jgi:hypothetical protein